MKKKILGKMDIKRLDLENEVLRYGGNGLGKSISKVGEMNVTHFKKKIECLYQRSPAED